MRAERSACTIIDPFHSQGDRGRLMDAFEKAIASEAKAALEEVAEFCTSLGHEIVPYTPPFSGPEFLDKFLLYWAAGAAEFAGQASAFSGKPVGPDIVEPWTLGLVSMFQARQTEMPETIAIPKPTYNIVMKF